MKTSEWPRMPGPWRLAHALKTGVFVGLIGSILLLAGCETAPEPYDVRLPQSDEQCVAQPELDWC